MSHEKYKTLLQIKSFLAFQLFSSSGQQFSDLCTVHNIVCVTKDSSPGSHIEVAGHCQSALIWQFLKSICITICFLAYFTSSIVGTSSFLCSFKNSGFILYFSLSSFLSKPSCFSPLFFLFSPLFSSSTPFSSSLFHYSSLLFSPLLSSSLFSPHSTRLFCSILHTPFHSTPLYCPFQS